MTTHAKFDVSVIGELNLDLVLYGLPAEFELDREHLASDMTITLGSSSAIFAHNLALLGSRVGFNSAIGSDPFGELCLERLAASGADVSAVKKLASQQTGLTVILPRPQKRYILTYPGAMAAMSFEDLNLDHLFSTRHLHISSYFLQRALRPRIAELFRLAKQAGLSTSLDTNDDPENRWDLDLDATLKFVDILFPNESEPRRLARQDDRERALQVLAQYVPLVVMKRGERGAVARRGKEQLTSESVRTSPVDTIGAGDSFDAGFLHSYLRGDSLESCLRFGNLTGALSTTRQGGTEAFRDAAHRLAFLAGCGKSPF
jgi:sugar/nucleoside kinase (ribokinase family)